jgi:hypothetical protein
VNGGRARAGSAVGTVPPVGIMRATIVNRSRQISWIVSVWSLDDPLPNSVSQRTEAFRAVAVGGSLSLSARLSLPDGVVANQGTE